MPCELPLTTSLYLVALFLVSNSLNILENNHLYQYQNKKLQHRMSFLLGTPFPLMKDSCVSPENCAMSHVKSVVVMFYHFVIRHYADSLQYDSVYLQFHSRMHLLRILILPLDL